MNTPTLYDFLSQKLEQKRKEHPSFQLMEQLLKTNEPLYPGNSTSLEMFEMHAKNSADMLKTPEEIVKESWSAGYKNHLMIIGEGGIGKTVCLLSLPRIFADKRIPAIYIPLNIVTKSNTNGSISDYLKQWIFDDDPDLYRRLIERIKLPWSSEPQLLLLLDGFNEIPKQHREPICNEIKLWSEYPGIQIITSSRFDIRNNLSSIPNFSKIELQPLNEETVDKYLSRIGIPIPQNKTARKLIVLPLLLALYAKTELFRSQSTTYKEANNAGSIIWNYLQSELLRYSNNEEDKRVCILALEFIAPYIAWKMQQSSSSSVDESFSVNNLDFVCWTNDSYEILKMHSNDLRSLPHQIAMQIWDELPEKKRFRQVLDNQLCLFVKNEDDSYSLMHQQFRDALAAMHLINLSYLSGDSLPKEWESPIDHYVMQFVADLISEKEATRLWEQNRNTKPAFENATRNQLRLQGLLHNDDFSELDFSGLDLSNISMYPYRINNAIIKLPPYPERMQNTKFSEKTFSAERHNDLISDVAVSQNGRFVISGSYDNTICIWDLESGCHIRTLKGHKDAVTSVAITPNGEHLVSGSYDNTIRIWELKSGCNIKTLRGHKNRVTSVAIMPNGKYIVSASDDRTIKLWDIETGLIKSKKENSSIKTVAVCPNGRHIVFGTAFGSVKIWDISTNRIRTLYNHLGSINSVTVNIEGNYITSSSYDGTIIVCHLPKRQILKEINEYASVEALAITPDSKHIVYGVENAIMIWDTETWSLSKTWEIDGNDAFINAVSMAPDGGRIILGTDSALQVWDWEDGICLNTLFGNTGYISTIKVTSDGKHIVSGIENTIQICEMKNRTCKKVFVNDCNLIYDLNVTSDNKRIISSTNNSIRIWNIKTGKCKSLIEEEGLDSIVISTDDQYMVVSSNLLKENTLLGDLSMNDMMKTLHDKSMRIRVWNLKSGVCINKKVINHLIYSIAISPDNSYIVIGANQALFIWKLGEENTPINKFGQIKSIATAIVITHDSNRIICGESNGTISIWDYKTRHIVKRLQKEHDDEDDSIEASIYRAMAEAYNYDERRVNSIAVTSDCNRIICSRDDRTITIWDTTTGNCINKTITQQTFVNTLAITPDDKHIISGTSNGTIYITDIETFEVKSIHILPLSVVELNFSKAEITSDKLRELLRQNGAKVDPD